MAVSLRFRTAIIPLAVGAVSLTLGFHPVFKTTKSLGRGASSPNPFSGKKLYVDPLSDARRQADVWRAYRPRDAAFIDRIARQPQAHWITEWSGDARRAVTTLVGRATREGALPLLVAYNIPQRDCGSYSAGGARNEAEYRKWIREFATGLRGANSVVILEPDALGLTCRSDDMATMRTELLRDAVNVLKHRGSAVYLDAGHPHWVAPTVMAQRLQQAGIAHANGFALNTANFHSTGDNISYGEAISRLVGGKHFIIDTSRNGSGSDRGHWCNAARSALGERPTAETGHPLVDAYLWIKRPGESDGPCGGGPRAGQWWAQYALELARRQPPIFLAGN